MVMKQTEGALRDFVRDILVLRTMNVLEQGFPASFLITIFSD